MSAGLALRLRAAAVEAVDRLVPKRLLRLAIHPRFHAFIGQDRIDVVGNWIDNRFMLKRRQQRTLDQPIIPSTRDYLATRFCPNPFTQLETAQTGLAYLCCPVWLPTPIGALDTPPEQLWHSAAAKEVRASILDGSFRHCHHLHCPSIANRTLPSREAPAARALIARYAAPDPPALPEHLLLSHDKSCNLSCPSCRGAVYMANATKQAQLDRLTEDTLLPLMRDARSVMITGSGDPFGSKHFRNLIRRLNGGGFPHLRIDLITNGILWDRRAWAELKLRGRVRSAQISIDAATGDTYVFCRRGGDFERLRKNLAFVRELRLSGELEALEFSMVVQARNFREMPAFVRLGEEFAADAVSFNMIRQRDIFSKEAYVEAFIGSPRHPDYAAFVETLKAPELAQPNSRLGNLLEYVRRADADYPNSGQSDEKCGAPRDRPNQSAYRPAPTSLQGRHVVIVHPAWHSCGTATVVAGQARAYRALGARVTAVAVCDNLDYGLWPAKAEAGFLAATPDLIADRRCFIGASRRAFFKLDFLTEVLWQVAHGNHPASMAGFARRADIPAALRADHVDLVHCNHFFCMPVAERMAAGRCPIAVETHDVQARQYQLRNAGGWFLHPRPSFERLLEQELALLRCVDLLVHLNSEEASFFQDRLPAKRHALIFPAVEDLSIGDAGDKGVLIAGGNYPNFQSVQSLLRDVYPLTGKPPLLIAGGVRDDMRRREPALFRANEGLFLGRQPDLQTVYDAAKYIVLPTVSGSGISIKSIEALASGLPIVATAHAFRGMAGLDIAGCRNVCIADTAESFAARIDELAAMPPSTKAERQASETRALYLAHFSDASLAGRFTEHLLPAVFG